MARGWHGDSAGHARAARKRGRKSGLSVSDRVKRIGKQLKPVHDTMSIATRMKLKSTKKGRKFLRAVGAREYAIEKLTGFRSMHVGIYPRPRRKKRK